MTKHFRFLVALALLATTGCATAPLSAAQPLEGPVKEKVHEWATAMARGDTEAVLAMYSPRFSHPQLGDLRGLKTMLDQAEESGFFEGVAFNESKVTVAFGRGRAVAYPLEASGSFGTAAVRLIFVEEAGGWKIITMKIEMY